MESKTGSNILPMKQKEEFPEKNETIRSPRTIRDYAMLDKLVWSDKSDEQISQFMKRKVWRSQVVESRAHEGQIFCAVCLQPISKVQCLECGQPEVSHDE